MIDDRRYEPRVPTYDQVNVHGYRYPGVAEFRPDAALGRTVDLSHRGLRLRLRRALPPRTTIDFDLALGERVLTLAGRVLSLTPREGDQVDLGVQFVGVTPEQYAALHEHIQLRGGDVERS